MQDDVKALVERLKLAAKQDDESWARDRWGQAARTIEAQAAEIERLRKRLEIPEPPFEHVDGIECRNETIRGLEAEIEMLRKNAEAHDACITSFKEAAFLAAENAENAIAERNALRIQLAEALADLICGCATKSQHRADVQAILGVLARHAAQARASSAIFLRMGVDIIHRWCILSASRAEGCAHRYRLET